MNVKHTLVAFLILLALGGAFYYLNRLPEKPDEKAIPKEDLFSFKAEDVEEFTLEEAGKPPATFRRRSAAAPGSGAAGSGQSQQWEITAPPGIAADSAQIQSFIEEIAGMQGTPVAVADPIQWSEYGFEPPARTYRFRLKNGQAFTFSIGGENPAGYARYARRNDAAPLLLIDNIDDKALIEKTLFDLRDQRILPINQEEAQRIELHFNLKGAQPSPEELNRAKQLGLPLRPALIVMTKQSNGNWQLDEPRLRTDYGATNYLFTSVVGGRMRSLEEENPASLAKYGLDRPQIRIDITTSSGKQSLLVGNQLTRGEEQLFYAKNTVWPHVFTIYRTVYDQLNQDQVYYRQRYLYDFDQLSAKSLEIQGTPANLRFELRGEQWYQTGNPEKKIDEIKMSNFLNAIHSLRISYYPSDEPNRFSAYGLDKPWMTTKVRFGPENREETVVFSRKGGKFYAARLGEPSVYELSSNEPENLEAKIKELLAEPPPAAPAGAGSEKPASR